MSTVVVSVRVRKKIKEELEKAGIDVSEAVRRYLEELAWKIRIRKTLEKWDKLLEKVKPSEPGFAAKSIREDRSDY